MRLFLLPISTRRTLIYCQRINQATSEQKTLVDKATSRASRLWLDWEKSETSWKKTVTVNGNKLLQRIAYEEWGLKSIPPLSTRPRADDAARAEKVSVSFPPSLISEGRVDGLMRTLATERQGLHRKRLLWSLLGMPITIPVAIIPVIPNIPFFYLVYRAWSHWRALYGSKHIEYLLDNSLIKPVPSAQLEKVYRTIKSSPARSSNTSSSKTSIQSSQSDVTTESLGPLARGSRPADSIGSGEEADEERMVLDQQGGQAIANTLSLPELNVELERAITQVASSLQAKADATADASGPKEGEGTATQHASIAPGRLKGGEEKKTR